MKGSDHHDRTDLDQSARTVSFSFQRSDHLCEQHDHLPHRVRLLRVSCQWARQHIVASAVVGCANNGIMMQSIAGGYMPIQDIELKIRCVSRRCGDLAFT
jgi:hypothetical protein